MLYTLYFAFDSTINTIFQRCKGRQFSRKHIAYWYGRSFKLRFEQIGSRLITKQGNHTMFYNIQIIQIYKITTRETILRISIYQLF